MSHLELLAPEVRADPYPFYAKLRKDHPVARVEPGGMYAVSRYHDVLAILRNPHAFSSAAFRSMWTPEWLSTNPIAYSMITADPPEHTLLRGLVSRAFEPRVIALLETRVREIAVELAERLDETPEIDFISEFGTPVPARVIAEILGIDASLHVRFKQWADALTAISPATPRESYDGIRGSIAEMEGYLRDVIAARRRAPAGDLVSVLVQPDASQKSLTDEEILSFLFLTLPAGFETVTHLLTHSMRVLTEHPALYAELRNSTELIPSFIEEALRYEPPVHGVLRFCTANVVVADTTIPAGSIVLALLGSANRDERHFANPDRFDLRRGAAKNISFGHGVHFCVGATLARLEARLAIEEIVRRYERVEVVPHTISWNCSMTARGPLNLPLRFHRAARAPAARPLAACGHAEL